ncbi:MAG TPA: hypothetical protein VLC09_09500 [Polyangiaceae bacterium]|nr:hypothetical protein [Polyangiaceae bacterium]
MKRLEPVIAELEAARSHAIARFAAEANMPVSAFQRHFRVIMEGSPGQTGDVSFRVEPIE